MYHTYLLESRPGAPATTFLACSLTLSLTKSCRLLATLCVHESVLDPLFDEGIWRGASLRGWAGGDPSEANFARPRHVKGVLVNKGNFCEHAYI